jgi:ubiquinone/menaquinone biosynthesis C-methylase UbiE
MTVTAHPELLAASKVWNRADLSLEEVEAWIHDYPPKVHDELPVRADGYVDAMFNLFPYAKIRDGATIMEIGSGVGYLMEGILRHTVAEGVDIERVIGLDIAENMIARARGRVAHQPKLDFLHYDGVVVPMRDQSLDFIYSVASLQHVPRQYVFNLFFEIRRLLKKDGFTIIHLLGYKHLLNPASPPWELLVDLQVKNSSEEGWLSYYSAEEIDTVLRATGFRHVDVKDGVSIWFCANK